MDAPILCQNKLMKTGTKRLAILAALLALAGCAPDTNSAAEPAAESAEDLVDLIIDGRYIVTMDASNSIIENGAVAVDDGVIIAVGSRDEIHETYSATEMLGGDNRIVLPGLVNGHSHAAMTILRGVADGIFTLMQDAIDGNMGFVDAGEGQKTAVWTQARRGIKVGPSSQNLTTIFPVLGDRNQGVDSFAPAAVIFANANEALLPWVDLDIGITIGAGRR